MKWWQLAVVAGLGVGLGWLARGQNDSTPFTYEICAADFTGCFVSARFKTLESCEKAKRQGGLHCTESNGEQRCTEPATASVYSSSRCL